MSYSPNQLDRLSKNYRTIAPRLGSVVSHFLVNIHEELAPSSVWELPTDEDHERLVSLISQIGQSFENPTQLVDTTDAASSMLDDLRFVAVKESFLTAIATTSDYTWTSQLRSDWESAFDLVPNMLVYGVLGKQHAQVA
ncbi:MAG: hypothetical protein P1U42_03880 [Phycisphaerales bacterium]|nr:hypothetical protein [Phycisphaerales bacterium]